mmetsp:Transcript_28283/g.81493  ORF Transcript_28283/g.81493 Transcript_28283/m.81493 type:complete len:200 (-) Transcript_28283:38-637(-)
MPRHTPCHAAPSVQVCSTRCIHPSIHPSLHPSVESYIFIHPLICLPTPPQLTLVVSASRSPSLLAAPPPCRRCCCCYCCCRCWPAPDIPIFTPTSHALPARTGRPSPTPTPTRLLTGVDTSVAPAAAHGAAIAPPTGDQDVKSRRCSGVRCGGVGVDTVSMMIASQTERELVYRDRQQTDRQQTDRGVCGGWIERERER